MKAKRFQFFIGALVVVALGSFLFLSACGGGVGSPTSPAPQNTPGTTSPPPATTPLTTTPPTTGTSIEIEVIMEDLEFPDEIRVKAGTKVVFVITNLGTVEHTFEMPDFDYKSKEIEPNETFRFEWTVPDEKGEWDIGCYLTEEGFHEGMDGILIIE